MLAGETESILATAKGIQVHIVGETEAVINQKLPTYQSKFFDSHFKALLEWIMQKNMLIHEWMLTHRKDYKGVPCPS